MVKIEVQLGDYGKATHAADQLSWQFEDGRVEIFAGSKLVATYARERVLWVKRVDETL